MRRPTLVVAVMITAILLASSAVAYAQQSDKTAPDKKTGPITTENHSWGNYHWAREANPFTLKVGDNVTAAWDPYLDTTLSNTSSGWSSSNVLDLTEVGGQTKPRRCGATAKRVEVCNASYGNNGWLGIASIWASGDHITQGTVKLNDTYYNTAQYNTPAWRNLVMCQEVGHDFGLDHQDEAFDNVNLGTCMDYTNDPSTNQFPNAHDYEMLQTIYGHLDSTTTVGQTSTASEGTSGDPNEPGNDPRAWGKEIFRSDDGRVSIHEKDLGKDRKKLTHVRWTEEKAAEQRGGQKEK